MKKVFVFISSLFLLSSAIHGSEYGVISYGVNLGVAVHQTDNSGVGAVLNPPPSLSPGGPVFFEAEFSGRCFPFSNGYLGFGLGFFLSSPHDDVFDFGMELTAHMRIPAGKRATINFGGGYIREYIKTDDQFSCWTDAGFVFFIGNEIYLGSGKRTSFYIEYRIKYLEFEESTTMYKRHYFRFGIHRWL